MAIPGRQNLTQPLDFSQVYKKRKIGIISISISIPSALYSIINHYQIMSFTLVYCHICRLWLPVWYLYGTSEHHDEETRL